MVVVGGWEVVEMRVVRHPAVGVLPPI